jgi:hypothetical protein
MTLQAALDALTSDAKSWDEVSGVLTSSSTTAGGLTVSTYSWPQVISEIPLAATYEKLRAKVETLLSDGGTETGDLAETLRKVRTAYEDTDHTARDRLHGTWDPIT